MTADGGEPADIDKEREWREKLVQRRQHVKLLVDENLPPRLARHVADLFPAVPFTCDG